MIERLISILIGYVCGNFLSGYFYGKKHDVDIRKSGSGNIGTTNTLRTLGKKAGLLALIGDSLKAIIASVIVYFIYRNTDASSIQLLMLYAGFGAILGHDFPFFMKFKGGKGIATSFGMIIICFPQTLPICAIAFFGAVFSTRFVSLGSILAAIAFGVQAIVMGYMGLLWYEGVELYEAIIIAVIIAVCAIVQHRSNIVRLINGNENKISLKGAGKNGN